MTDFGAGFGYKTDDEMADFTGGTEVGTVTTQGGTVYHKVQLDAPAWHQYFIADGIPTTKNGSERPYEEIKKDKKKIKKRIDRSIVCPMNYLQNWLDKIQGAVKDDSIDTYAFFQKIKGKANEKQMSKIRVIVKEYDGYVTKNLIYGEDNQESFNNVLNKTEEIITTLQGMKLSAVTMNRLIETSLGIVGRVREDRQYIDATKYTTRTLNILYRMDKDKFLSNFKQNRNI
jgi:hypothetical protein